MTKMRIDSLSYKGTDVVLGIALKKPLMPSYFPLYQITFSSKFKKIIQCFVKNNEGEVFSF